MIIYIHQLIRGVGGLVFRNDNANDSQLQSDNDSRCAGESVSEAPTYRIESHTHCTTLVQLQELHCYGATATIYKVTEIKLFKHVKINLIRLLHITSSVVISLL